ncbi:hypothetical protein Pmani_026700 [Petrolisthes manimaculis]|uniref:Uncharacterized protein n=1 Tax=Petrolisthes manimaculis TaxID=1843537 RepID=A0AAE1TZV6_9EUCA|nr:hypothetical protein Pmani_026700 [Petrolisthes manimaculis]
MKISLKLSWTAIQVSCCVVIVFVWEGKGGGKNRELGRVEEGTGGGKNREQTGEGGGGKRARTGSKEGGEVEWRVQEQGAGWMGRGSRGVCLAGVFACSDGERRKGGEGSLVGHGGCCDKGVLGGGGQPVMREGGATGGGGGGRKEEEE